MTTIIRNPLGLSGEGPQVVGQQRPALESSDYMRDPIGESNQVNPTWQFSSPLLAAVNVNDIDLVIKNLQDIAAGRPTVPDEMKIALYLAITKGYSECLEAILNHDSRLLEIYIFMAPPGIPGSNRTYISVRSKGTPLLTALLYNKFDIAKSLIDRGASLEKTTIGMHMGDYNPIDIVLANSYKNDKDSKYPDMIKYLCNHGAVPSMNTRRRLYEYPESFDTPSGKAIQECERVTVNPLEGLQGSEGSEAGQQASFLNPFRPQGELNPFRKIGGRRTRRKASRRKASRRKASRRKLRRKTTYRKVRKTRQRSR